MATASVEKLSEQILQNPLTFVPARDPEAVSVKPSSYVVIKGQEEGGPTTGDGSVGNEISSPAKANGAAPATTPTTTEPKTRFYDINELSNDGGSRKSDSTNKIQKSWGGVSQSPIGLINRGVTCYMNSAIQALIHLPAIAHYLLDIQAGKYKSTIERNSVTQEFSNLYARLTDRSSKKRALYPTRIVSRLSDINCMMSEWNQEDAHEYFMSFMSRLQEDSVPKGKKLNSSIVHDIFGGQLVQRVKCSSCEHVSVTHQDFYDLPVTFSSKELKKKGSYSLMKSVHDFFAPEAIKTDGETTGYTCENCKKRSNAIKQCRIEHAPEYLTVHMKRFKYSGRSGQKVKEAMSYPMELDLDPYSLDSEQPVRYKLMAVIVHEGRSLSSGHYIAFCRQPNGETWAEYDDEMIRKVGEKTVLNQESAYILIYSRLKPKPKPKGPRPQPQYVAQSQAQPQHQSQVALSTKKSLKRAKSFDDDNAIDRIFSAHEKRQKVPA